MLTISKLRELLTSVGISLTEHRFFGAKAGVAAYAIAIAIPHRSSVCWVPSFDAEGCAGKPRNS